MRNFVQQLRQFPTNALAGKLDRDSRASARHLTPAPLVAFDFRQIPIYPQPPVPLQAKLTVSVPGDPAEQEADRVSEEVMRATAPPGPCACGDCAKCRESGHPPERIHTKRAGSALPGPVAAPPALQKPMRSPGEPLDEATRGLMESRFAWDFSRVRVHTGSEAGWRAEAVGARAYTLGRDIVFGAGEYAPASPAGRQLIAHELAHVVQQAAGNPEIQRQVQPGNPPPAQASSHPMEFEILGADVEPKEPLAVMADQAARQNKGRVLIVRSLEDMIGQLDGAVQGKSCIGKLVVWYHGSPDIQALTGKDRTPGGAHLPRSGFTRDWLQLVNRVTGEEPHRPALNKFRHLFCCNGMMQWIGCATSAVRAGGGLRTDEELKENPDFEAFPDAYSSPAQARQHGAKLTGASLGALNVQAWANATCVPIRSASDFVTIDENHHPPTISIDNNGVWQDVKPQQTCPCDPSTGRVAGEAPSRAEMVKQWQAQTKAEVGSQNVLWHELLLTLRTGLPHSTAIIGSGETGERTFDIQPGTLPARLREEIREKKHTRTTGPLERSYVQVLFEMLQIALEGLTPPAPLPDIPITTHPWIIIASGGTWAAVTQRHLAVTHPNNFWEWTVWTDRAIGETPEFTRTVIEHELEHAADYKKDFDAFQTIHPPPAGSPPKEFTLPAEESAVRQFGGDWGKYINDFVDFQKAREKPERHLEIILGQRTQAAPGGGPSFNQWSAGERAYWFQLVMDNLPPDVNRGTPVPGEDQVLDAFNTAGATLQLAAIERAYTTLRRAICPPAKSDPADIEKWRANARTLVQHFDPIMDALFKDKFQNTSPAEVLRLLRRPASAARGLECNL
jgi:hypothetical protein